MKIIKNNIKEKNDRDRHDPSLNMHPLRNKLYRSRQQYRHRKRRKKRKQHRTCRLKHYPQNHKPHHPECKSGQKILLPPQSFFSVHRPPFFLLLYLFSSTIIIYIRFGQSHSYLWNIFISFKDSDVERWLPVFWLVNCTNKKHPQHIISGILRVFYRDIRCTESLLFF